MACKWSTKRIYIASKISIEHGFTLNVHVTCKTLSLLILHMRINLLNIMLHAVIKIDLLVSYDLLSVT